MQFYLVTRKNPLDNFNSRFIFLQKSLISKNLLLHIFLLRIPVSQITRNMFRLSFSQSGHFPIHDFLTRVTRRVSPVEQELVIILTSGTGTGYHSH